MYSGSIRANNTKHANVLSIVNIIETLNGDKQ